MFETDRIEVTKELLYHVVEGETVTPISDPGAFYELMTSKGYVLLSKTTNGNGQKQVWVRNPEHGKRKRLEERKK